MEEDNVVMDAEMQYPILFLPKKCTSLETNCELTDNVFIDLNISSPDMEGNETSIYTGFCNVKLIDSYDVNINFVQSPNHSISGDIDLEQIPVVLSEANQITYPTYNQSQVWIDPSRSPYVYNNYDPPSKEQFSVHHETRSHITVEQHNTYITQNVYNCKETNISPLNEFEHKKFRKAQELLSAAQSDMNFNLYEEDEFECGVFLSQLPEEILNEKQSKARDERKYLTSQSENNALKQLMSSDIQSVSKQQKTILFLGHDSLSGQTIQNISYNDPMMKCVSSKEAKQVEECVIVDESSPNRLKKKYQCDKCKQIFDQISAFRQHMVGDHSAAAVSRPSDVKFLCTECGKSLKSQKKFEIHCMGHGDPEVECNKCHKVFASKFTLRAHRKIHNRKHPCNYCLRVYASAEELRAHTSRVHFIFTCEHSNCEYVTGKYTDCVEHLKSHTKESSETDFAESYIGEVSDGDIVTTEVQLKSEDEREVEELIKAGDNEASMEPPDSVDDLFDDDDDEDYQPEEGVKESEGEKIRKADSVIAKVMSNEIFLLHSKKAKKHSRYHNKTCEVCFKSFDRIGDLKRHLIEHVIRSTLAKTPANRSGTLTIVCEVCQRETFTRVDKYKAHLREHAKLTLYKCTFCDKSFSDSSNFSKHKKIHGVSYLQCDLCQRKFNSKKMITQHMEYHNKNAPIKCKYCSKVFHFESMLNKHMKCAHSKETSKFRCRFCEDFFKTLKEKWDHEWTVHNIRKMIVDCLICGCKFRKYSELKRHCLDDHCMEIPPAKRLLKKKRRYS